MHLRPNVVMGAHADCGIYRISFPGPPAGRRSFTLVSPRGSEQPECRNRNPSAGQIPHCQRASGVPIFNVYVYIRTIGMSKRCENAEPARHFRSRRQNPCVDGPRFARTCCSWGRVWSIAVMCPALMCGRIDRGPRWVTRIGLQTSRRGARPKGFPGVFRSSVRPIAILLLSLQAPGQNEVSELRPEAAGDKPHRSPSWPRASEPSCWPARLLQVSSACALAD